MTVILTARERLDKVSRRGYVSSMGSVKSDGLNTDALDDANSEGQFSGNLVDAHGSIGRSEESSVGAVNFRSKTPEQAAILRPGVFTDLEETVPPVIPAEASRPEGFKMTREERGRPVTFGAATSIEAQFKEAFLGSSNAHFNMPVQDDVPAAPPSPEPVKLTAIQRLAAASASSAIENNTRQVKKSMAAMKSLTRLLEAVYSRPGAASPVNQRMKALSELSSQTYALSSVVASLANEDADRSAYMRAMAMDAAVGLVCKAWEQEREVNWPALLKASSEAPEIMRAADALAEAAYLPVTSAPIAADRLAISMHSAFWQVHELGNVVDGVTPRLAAEIVRDCVDYLQQRERFVLDNDMHVSWLQGSLRRMTDLVTAEARARFRDNAAPMTKADAESILLVARSGFEGVENYAQSILDDPSRSPVSRPVDS